MYRKVDRSAWHCSELWHVDLLRLLAKLIVVIFGLTVGFAYLWQVPRELAAWPAGVDLEIPLRAASNWSHGVGPYPPSAMLVYSGPDLPYLYPPYLLPFLTPIAALPRDLVIALWLTGCGAAAIWTCRRLGVRWLVIPFVLAWPPFVEGLTTGNVQILAFAAFVALLYQPPGIARPRPIKSDRAIRDGLLSAWIGALKVVQLLPIVFVARRSPRTGLVAILLLAAIAVAVLPLTGLAIYADWLAQLQRASDPNWGPGGTSIGRLLGLPDPLFVVVGLTIALLARGRNAAAWLGLAMIAVNPSVHGYTYLFLLPGLLSIRREFAIAIGVLFLGPYPHGWWLATASIAVLLIASPRRQGTEHLRGCQQIQEESV
jgi:Glycosyltransferase family 87